MTRAIITQLVAALETGWSPQFTGKDARALSDAAITAAREYLATEPCAARAELIARQRGVQENGINAEMRELAKATADMLEADAQPKSFLRERAQLEQEWCELRKLKQAQQAKRVPMTEKQIDKIYADTARLTQIRTTFFVAFARAIESHINTK